MLTDVVFGDIDDDAELSFQPGDILTFEAWHPSNEEWCFCKIHDKRGLVPVSYIEVLDDVEAAAHQATQTFVRPHNHYELDVVTASEDDGDGNSAISHHFDKLQHDHDSTEDSKELFGQIVNERQSQANSYEDATEA